MSILRRQLCGAIGCFRRIGLVIVFIAVLICCCRSLGGRAAREWTRLEGMMHPMGRGIEDEKEQSGGEATANRAASIEACFAGEGLHGTLPRLN